MSLDGSEANVLQLEIQAVYQALQAQLTRIIGRRDIAQELCQDSIVRLMENQERVLDVRAWLFRTATHLAWDWLRRQRVQESYLSSVRTDSTEVSAMEHAVANEGLQRLRQALQRMPGQARRVFELSRFTGLSQKEIAANMGLERKTVENHLTRALALLARALGGHDERRH